ncbi:MAG: hypothetical protein ACTSSG_07270 [Candidatus Heimdallarchaeaceae archaeon]
MNSSEPKKKKKTWKDFINFKKQSLRGRILLISSVLFFGSLIVFNFLTLIVGKWKSLGIYSIWILFGWLFFIVLIYISAKLISLLIETNEHKMDEFKQEQEESKEKSKGDDN